MKENRRRREATCKQFGIILWLCRRHKQQNGTGIGNQRQHRQQNGVRGGCTGNLKQYKASKSAKHNKMQRKVTKIRGGGRQLASILASFCGFANVISSKMAPESAIRGNIGSKMRQEAAASAIRSSIRHLNQQNISK